jgi:hypothetical protein
MTFRPGDLRKDRIYSRAMLLDRGMHRRHLASAAMVRVFPGWWMRSDAEPTLSTLAEVFQQSIRPGAVISHETAAEIFGFPLPRAMSRGGGAPLHCRGPDGRGHTSGGLVVVHRPVAAPTIRLDGITMSHPLVALQELAPRLDAIDLVVCLDALAADRHGTRERMRIVEIAEFLGTMSGRGAPALRRALPAVRERSWSPMETRLRLLLVGRGYPEPELNVEVRDPATGNRYFLDLAYPAERIAIEYDGDEHRTNRRRWHLDLQKNVALQRMGWSLHRVTMADYLRPGDVLAGLDHAFTRGPLRAR